jgi:hypothetical protein
MAGILLVIVLTSDKPQSTYRATILPAVPVGSFLLVEKPLHSRHVSIGYALMQVVYLQFVDQPCKDLVPDQSPNLTNVVHFSKSTQGAIGKGVR